MSAYTQDLINILYTGIYHDFEDIYDFMAFMERNMDYEFSEGVSYSAEDTAFVYYINGESFFVANIDDEKIVFSPGEAFEAITEEPELVKEALLSFLIYFKNYDTLDNIDDIQKDFKKSKSKPKRKGMLALGKSKIKFVDEDPESESEEISEEISDDKLEEESESDFDDEWI